MKHNYFLPVMVFICITFCITLNSYNENKEFMSSYIAQLDDLNAQIDSNNEIIEGLQTDISYYSSQEFVEKIAREKLGLVKDNEIIFKEN